MSENENQQPVEQAPVEPADETPTPKRRFRDRFTGGRERAVGLRGAIAVGLAGVILGGLGGTALGFALDGDHHRDGDSGRHGQPFDRMGGDDRGAPPAPPNSQPGGVPPTTLPEEEGSAS